MIFEKKKLSTRNFQRPWKVAGTSTPFTKIPFKVMFGMSWKHAKISDLDQAGFRSTEQKITQNCGSPCILNGTRKSLRMREKCADRKINHKTSKGAQRDILDRSLSQFGEDRFWPILQTLLCSQYQHVITWFSILSRMTETKLFLIIQVLTMDGLFRSTSIFFFHIKLYCIKVRNWRKIIKFFQNWCKVISHFTNYFSFCWLKNDHERYKKGILAFFLLKQLSINI